MAVGGNKAQGGHFQSFARFAAFYQQDRKNQKCINMSTTIRDHVESCSTGNE